MAINKKLIHFNTFENFNSKKLSANIENTKYTLGVNGEIQKGSPDILYQSIVYIKDTKQQWTHGQLYTSDDNYFETKVESQNKLQEAKDYTDSKIFKPQENIVTQTIQLNQGWNWVSFYVETSLEKLQNALGTNGIEIKYMDFTTSYDEESGLWLSAGNPLTSIEPSKMYMINTNSDCVIELEGKLLEDVEITLNSGVNWIAYPLNVSMDVNMAFMHLEVTDGDDIKSDEREFSGYLEGWGWDGNLSILEPGQGYVYTNNSSETKTFKYPTELDIKLLNYETKEDSISKLQESKDYTDIKTDELRDVVTQTLSLTSNYNWCSFYVDITLEQLQRAFGTNVTSIAISFDGGETQVKSTYNADTNTWSGNLTTLDTTKMYEIIANTNCEISLIGKKIPNSTIYTLNPGWNWISFPMNTSTLVKDALSKLSANNDDVIEGKSGYATYYEGYGWIGTLETLEPGQGYMYQNTSTEPNTLVFTTELIDTKSELNKKQDTITDLEVIRQGAAKGATALQEHQDISSKADVYGNPNGIVVKEDNPQNSINIHPRGIIESESWKYNEAFSTEWIPYFLLSGNSLSLGSGVSTDDGFKIEAVQNIRTQDRSDEEFLRTSHTMIQQYDERGNSKGTGLLLTDDFIQLYAYNPESEIDISENMTELEVPFNDSIFDTRLRGIAEPVSNHDAVNKKYVDDNYVSVNNIKTINGQSLLGEGDIVISSEGNGETDMSNYYTKEEIDNIIEQSGGVSITKTPIVRTTINNEDCYVDVDTKTYITCEGNAHIFLKQYEDDEYVHSYEIVLLIGESGYSISFPNNIKWIKPLTITKNTRYNIIIEDNIATWVSIQN